jgi:hypothetical protein
MPALPPDPPEPAHEPDERTPERFGPLLLWRLVKEDGRSLINFSWAGHDGGAES